MSEKMLGEECKPVTVRDYEVQLRVEKAIIEALDLWDEKEIRKVVEETLEKHRRE